MSDQRLNPETYLKRVQEEERKEKHGKLKIYLGAAPGVGKTHEMLQDALKEYEKGLDVIVGVVESHGREEIEALLKQFKILPRVKVDYRGIELLDFDIDGAIARHPALILIDEMAHTNPPGFRHKKRWQDIKELLDRGIDVCTTLNVQHIESLNDVVAQITHSPIQETVPDSMLEMADTIELVDLPPEELLERLHEGKVYFPEQASLAAENFFRKGNLIALRELALRTMAERVGAQVLLYRQGQGIKHIWPSMDKILVCVGSGPEGLKVIRAAKRMANSMQAEWIVVYVDTPRIKDAERKRQSAITNLRLAEELGAETHILIGLDIVSTLMTFARTQNITMIMIWKHIRSRWRNGLFKSLADEIVRSSREIDVYIMTGSIDTSPQPKPAPTTEKIPYLAYAFSIGMVVIATAVNFYLFEHLRPSNLIMIYFLAVSLIAMLGKAGPSFLGSVLSVLAYDFFFIPPYYSFSVADFDYFLTLAVMLIVSQVIGQLTVMTRRQVDVARLAEQKTSALYELTRRLAKTRGKEELLNIGLNHLSKMFNAEVLALMPVDDHLAVYTKDKQQIELDAKEMAVAQWVYELGQKAGLGTDSLSFSRALYIPLLGPKKVLGVLRLYSSNPEDLLAPDQIHLLEASCNQLALALAR